MSGPTRIPSLTLASVKFGNMFRIRLKHHYSRLIFLQIVSSILIWYKAVEAKSFLFQGFHSKHYVNQFSTVISLPNLFSFNVDRDLYYPTDRENMDLLYFLTISQPKYVSSWNHDKYINCEISSPISPIYIQHTTYSFHIPHIHFRCATTLLWYFQWKNR